MIKVRFLKIVGATIFISGVLMIWYNVSQAEPAWVYNWVSHLKKTQNEELACGEVCSYNGTKQAGRFYPYIQKQVKCNSILLRMGSQPSEPIYPPPKIPPKEIYSDYTQNGQCPLRLGGYSIGFKPKEQVSRVYITRQEMEHLLNRDKIGEIVKYHDSGLLREVLNKFKKYIVGKRALVVGTIKPWLEAMLVNLNVSQVITSEYMPLYIDHPKLRVQHPKDVGQDFLSGRLKPFDVAATFSSIEHSGLGRYGDPLDPFGDLQALAQVWCMVKPGGILFLGLPMHRNKNECSTVWNLHRVYGYPRLQHLTANWHVVEMGHSREEREGSHSVLVLMKPIL